MFVMCSGLIDIYQDVCVVNTMVAISQTTHTTRPKVTTQNDQCETQPDATKIEIEVELETTQLDVIETQIAQLDVTITKTQVELEISQIET